MDPLEHKIFRLDLLTGASRGFRITEL